MHTLLAKVTTTDLYLQFSMRDEARRVLRAIRFRAGSTVYLRDMSKGYSDKRPIIALSELKNVDKVLYYGRMVMLAEDLTAALDSDHVSLTTQDASAKQVYWVAKLGEEYFKTHETKNERLTSVYGLFQYVYEREVDNEGARRNSEPRKIRVFGHCCDGVHKFNEVSFVVENFAE